MVDIKTLNREIKKGDLVIGTRTVIKAIKRKELAKIYVSNDILFNLLSELEKEAKAHDIKIFKLELNKEQLKELCKKPFFISVFAIKKGNEEKETEREEGNEVYKEKKENKKEEIREKPKEEKKEKPEEKKKDKLSSEKKEKKEKAKEEKKK